MFVYAKANIKIYTGTLKVWSVNVWEKAVQDVEMVY